ncbi:hypothetical protein INT43_006044 [Umbelopsis isabellina]|uniref:Velvet domain-containing protein n=1 Tax=Mortierella isabellina TaxID=91625 RepID=A0A8H7UB24_MORIS|nr:hypothetical protein INT43_006044 [Umbelopsis isabellina]
MISEDSSESSTCTYRFLPSLDDHVPPRISHILMRQEPQQAKQSVAFDRERRPLEPPPIVQITFDNLNDQEIMTCLQSPYYFMTARLVTPDSTLENLIFCDEHEEAMTGSVVSSLHRLKDVDNHDAGFFVFGDLAIKIPGVFRLHFSLFEIQNDQVINRETIATQPFTVYSPKQFPGPLESTFLSRTFADQGVRMRIRKEHRMHSKATVPNKRKAATTQAGGGDETAQDKPNRRTSTRQRNHSVRFVPHNPVYGPKPPVNGQKRQATAAGRVATTTASSPDLAAEDKDYHVGKFRFERESSRQPSNSPPMELLAHYAEQASMELSQTKISGYPSPPHHQHPQVKHEYTNPRARSIPSPPKEPQPVIPQSVHTLPVPVRSALPNSVLPPAAPLSVHRNSSQVRLPSIRDLMGWTPSDLLPPPPPPPSHHPPSRTRQQEEEIAHAMMQLASEST